jgi:hypothetical protein
MESVAMTLTRLVAISSVAATLISVSCSSNESKGGSHGSGGTGNFINFDSGLGAKSALDTTDGLQPLTADQADLLKSAASHCQGWSSEPEKGPAVLEFQVDVSNSMSESAPSTGSQSKWQVMQSALPQAFQKLPASWAVGLAFFNVPQQGQCFQGRQAVPIAQLTAQQQTALASAIQAQGTAGWTPTEPAWAFALQQIQAYTGSGSANRYIVLVTDGIPTVTSDGCTRGTGPVDSVTAQEYSHLVATVGSGAAAGVKTFVVGVPGSEDPQGASYDPMYELSLVAQAGSTTQGCTPAAGTIAGTHSVSPRGTYCHYDMTQVQDFSQGLLNTVASIANSVVTCDLKVPAAPDGQTIDPNKVNMVYDDGNGNSFLVLQNTADNCDRGWHFTDSTNQAINICSITCALLQANPNARLTLTFGCSSNQTPA